MIILILAYILCSLLALEILCKDPHIEIDLSILFICVFLGHIALLLILFGLLSKSLQDFNLTLLLRTDLFKKWRKHD